MDDIADELHKNPWLIYGYLCTKEYHIQQPDPGKRLADMPVERGQELALKVAKKAREVFLKDEYREEALQNIEEILTVIKDCNYHPDKWDYILLQKYEYRMHIARKMLKAESFSDKEISNMTDLTQSDLERIKEKLYMESDL